MISVRHQSGVSLNVLFWKKVSNIRGSTTDLAGTNQVHQLRHQQSHHCVSLLPVIWVLTDGWLELHYCCVGQIETDSASRFMKSCELSWLFVNSHLIGLEFIQLLANRSLESTIIYDQRWRLWIAVLRRPTSGKVKVVKIRLSSCPKLHINLV